MEDEHRSMDAGPSETNLPITSAAGGGEHEEQGSNLHRDWPLLLPIGLLAAAELALLIAWLALR
jgi:hypothetical protein